MAKILIQIKQTTYEAVAMNAEKVTLEGRSQFSEDCEDFSLHEYRLALVEELLWALSEDDLDKEKALEAIRNLFSGLDIQARLDMKEGAENA